MFNSNTKQSIFKPYDLTENPFPYENEKLNFYNELLKANDNKKNIYWTSLSGITQHIKKITVPTVIINLTKKRNMYPCDGLVTCIDIDIDDNPFGDTIEDIKKEFTKIVSIFKDWYNNVYVDIIIHCLQGQHRSFSLAALLSLFLLNKDIKDKLTVNDFYKHAEYLQLKYNNYELSPTHIEQEQLNELYDIFKIMF